MQARQTLTPGRKSTKSSSKGTANNRSQVCYHYDEQRHKRSATVEIIVEKSGWSSPERPEIVGLPAKCHETELKRRVKKVSGKWISAKRVWEIHRDQAPSPGLKKKIVKLEVSDIRQHQVSNTRHH